MTPEKQKAIELVAKFNELIEKGDIYWNATDDAKECAKIAIDEIISACEYNRVESWNTDWWNRVKLEIDTLKKYIEDETER